MECVHTRDNLIAVEGTTKFVCPMCRATLDEAALISTDPDTGARELPRGPEVFVSRDAELRALWGAWADAVTRDRPHVALLRGVPGIGKTAIVEQFYRTVARSSEWDPEDYWPDAPPGRLDQISDRKHAEAWKKRRGRTPLFMWFAARCNRADPIASGDDDAVDTAELDPWKHMLLSTQIHRGIGTGAWRRWIPILGDTVKAAAMEGVGALVPFAGFIKEVGESVRRSVQGRDKELEEAVEKLDELVLRTFARMCDADAGGLPLILFFDDLQWADGRSLDKLRELLDRAAGQPLLIIGTVRTVDAVAENRPVNALVDALERRAGDDLGFTTLDIGTLDAAAIADQLRTLLGPGADPDAVAWLAAKADGVPLFADELARLAIHAGLLDTSGQFAGGAGEPCLDAAWDDGTLPHDVRGVIDERLERLAKQDWRQHQLLGFGAVQGRRFEDRLLAAAACAEAELAELDTPAVRRKMQAAERVHAVIHGEAPVPVGDEFRCSYIYTHGLIHEAFARTLRVDQRAACLRLLIDLLDGEDHETMMATLTLRGRQTTLYEQLAAIAELTEREWQRAVRIAQVFVGAVLAVDSIAAAETAGLRCLALAQTFAERHPSTPAAQVAVASALELRAEIAWSAGKLDDAAALLADARGRVTDHREHDDRRLVLLWLLAQQARFARARGDFEAAVAYQRERVAMARAMVDADPGPFAYTELIEAQRELADALIHEPKTAQEAEQIASEVMQTTGRCVEEDDDAVEHHGRAMADLADILIARDKHDEARSLRRELLAFARGRVALDDSTDARALLVDALIELGGDLSASDDDGEACELLEEAVSIANQLIADTGDADAATRLDASFERLSDVLHDAGDEERLRELLSQRIELNQRRVDEGGGVRARVALRDSVLELGRFLAMTNPPAARVVLSDHLALARALYDDLGDLDSEDAVSEGLLELAKHTSACDVPGDSNDFCAEALDFNRRRARHSQRREVLESLARSLAVSALAATDGGRTDDAVAHTAEALDICRDLLTRHDDVLTRADLALALEHHADTLSDAGDAVAALAASREAVALRRGLRDLDPGELEPTDALVESLRQLADFVRTGDEHTALEAEIEQLEDTLAQ